MLAGWFERGGLGQIVAPDEKAKSLSVEKSEDEKREEGFWSVVAPDPKFDAGTSNQEGNEPRVGPPPSLASPEPEQVQCAKCHEWTPVDHPTTPHSSSIPRDTASSNTTTEADEKVDSLVLSAAKETAKSMMSPSVVADARRQVLELCASAKPLTEKKSKKLGRLLDNDPSLARARATKMGNLVLDGYTPLMAASAVNHVVAARIVLERAPDAVLDRDLQGRTAIHIAAEHGCLEMVDLLKDRYPEGQDAPVDLTGHTPFGRAVTSQHRAAKQQQSELSNKLYTPQDRSVTGKRTPAKMRSSHLDLGLVYGHAEMPGVRIQMEDAICLHSWPDHALFGVCDGHGDYGRVSDFVATNVAPILKEELLDNTDITLAWTKTCLNLDAQLQDTGRQGGSTAVLALVTETNIVVANVGDSRCILIQQAEPDIAEGMEQLSLSESDKDEQQPMKDDETPTSPDQQEETTPTEPPVGVSSSSNNGIVVTPMSEDHKPNLDVERARIERAGLSVFSETFMDKGKECTIHKVQRSETDRMAVSRSFGDFEYKANEELPAEEQAIVAVPEVRIHAREKDRDMFLVLACDGVFDVMSNDEVADFVVKNVQDAIKEGTEDILLSQVGDMLVNECLQRGSTDNMSTVIVALSKTADSLGGGSPAVEPKRKLDY